MDQSIKTYQNTIDEGSAGNNQVGRKYPTISDGLFVNLYIVISLILLGYLCWKFISIFS